MKKLLLIIEDEQLQAGVLAGKFREENFDVIIATDGAEGLKLAKEKHPDVILLDIILPKITGLELLENLRGDEWGKTVKVVILSNLTTFEDHKELLGDDTSHLIKADSSLDEIIGTVKGSSN